MSFAISIFSNSLTAGVTGVAFLSLKYPGVTAVSTRAYVPSTGLPVIVVPFPPFNFGQELNIPPVDADELMKKVFDA